MNKIMKSNAVPTDKITRKLDFTKCQKDVRFRLTRGDSLNSWMAWVSYNGDENWQQLRPAVTTFESAQMAIYDEMISWAFPR